MLTGLKRYLMYTHITIRCENALITYTRTYVYIYWCMLISLNFLGLRHFRKVALMLCRLSSREISPLKFSRT